MLTAFMEKIRARGRSWGRAGEVSCPLPSGAESAPEPPEPAPSAADPPGPLSRPDASDRPRAPASEISRVVRRRADAEILDLRHRFASDGRWPDAACVLDQLGHPGRVIRQPPLAAQSVLRVLRREYGLDEVIRLLEKDPAMTQALLSHANSAWHAGLSAEPVTGLKAAIQRVGHSGVHAMVMQCMIQQNLSRPGAGLDPLARMVWEHMVRVAPMARGMAPLFGAEPDDAFTLALLHDVGKLVFFDGVAGERRRLRRDLGFPDGFVSASLGRLHESLGGLAALEWGLDPRAARVIATHHRAEEYPAPEPLSEVVYVAEAIDIAYQRGGKPDFDAIWTAGAVTAPPEPLAAWLERNEPEISTMTRAERRRQALRG